MGRRERTAYSECVLVAWRGLRAVWVLVPGLVRGARPVAMHGVVLVHDAARAEQRAQRGLDVAVLVHCLQPIHVDAEAAHVSAIRPLVVVELIDVRAVELRRLVRLDHEEAPRTEAPHVLVRQAVGARSDARQQVRAPRRDQRLLADAPRLCRVIVVRLGGTPRARAGARRGESGGPPTRGLLPAAAALHRDRQLLEPTPPRADAHDLRSSTGPGVYIFQLRGDAIDLQV
eukprot:COSAG06_NODE_1049_length_10959_cov_25.742449_3_plen_230_part_00